MFSKYIKNKIDCIGNPIDINKIKKLADAYNINECYDMIFLGRLTEAKNPELLIKIIENLIAKKPSIINCNCW